MKIWHSFSLGLVMLVLLPNGLVQADRTGASGYSRDLLLNLSWENSGVDPRNAVQLLRQAVAKDPHDIELWSALIHMLGIYGHHNEAEQASRNALRLNPANSDLLVARAAILRPSPALDVLNELSKIPNQKEQAERLSEIVRLGLSIPQRFAWNQTSTYIRWADRLIYTDQIDRAEKVLDEGIQKTAGVDHHNIDSLKQRKAIVLALQNRFAEAIELQKELHFPQIDVEAKYVGIGDVLLTMQQPKLAIESFGGNPHGGVIVQPEDAGQTQFRDREHVRVFAWACAMIGQWDDAKSQLINSDNLFDRLILLRIYTKSGDVGDASMLGNKIVGPLRMLQGSHSGPPIPGYGTAASLTPEYISAVKWLLEQYPAKSDLIKMYVGAPNRVETYRPFEVGFLPASQLIPKLRAALIASEVAGDDKKTTQVRKELITALSDDSQFSQAAREAAPLATAPPSRWQQEHDRVNDAALQWSILNRRADAEKLFQKDPAALTSAYKLLEIVDARRWNIPHADDSLTPVERIANLSQLGPGVLAAVYDDLKPNTISGDDRTLFVKVIQNIGGPQDAPVLIDTLGLLAPYTLGNSHHPSPQQDNADIASRDAIENCLEKLTGQNSGTDDSSRLEFWLQWWDANAQKVIDAAN